MEVVLGGRSEKALKHRVSAVVYNDADVGADWAGSLGSAHSITWGFLRQPSVLGAPASAMGARVTQTDSSRMLIAAPSRSAESGVSPAPLLSRAWPQYGSEREGASSGTKQWIPPELNTSTTMTGGRALGEMLKLTRSAPMFGMVDFSFFRSMARVPHFGLKHALINDERSGAFAADAYACVAKSPRGRRRNA